MRSWLLESVAIAALGITCALAVMWVLFCGLPAQAACEMVPKLESFPGRPISPDFTVAEPSNDCEGTPLGSTFGTLNNSLRECSVKATRILSDGTRRSLATWTIPASRPQGGGQHVLHLAVTTNQVVELLSRCRNDFGWSPPIIQYRTFTMPTVPTAPPPVP